MIQRLIGEALDASQGEVLRVVSLCAGDGRDLLGVLKERPNPKVRARLVESDPRLVETARRTIQEAGLREIEIVEGDASLTDLYEGQVPADLVLVCGIFGNISDQDVRTTVAAMPSFCARGGIVIWTRHRREPDLTSFIRAWFTENGFRERNFISPGPDSFAVGVHQLETDPAPLVHGQTLFTFTR